MYAHSATHHGRVLKLAGATAASVATPSNRQGFRPRQRFNQNLDDSIQELKTEQASLKKKLRLGSKSPPANPSQYS